MALSTLVCTTITVWIEEEILEPIEQVIQRSAERCRELPWWNPLRWFCWVITWFVTIIEWVLRNILVPIMQTICTLVVSIISFVGAPILAAVDALFGTNSLGWWQLWTAPHVHNIDFQQNIPITESGDGNFIYTFTCTCQKDDPVTITVEARDLIQAKRIARRDCIRRCAG